MLKTILNCWVMRLIFTTSRTRERWHRRIMAYGMGALVFMVYIILTLTFIGCLWMVICGVINLFV